MVTLESEQRGSLERTDSGYIVVKGDCLEVLNETPPDTFDMIFADPPYNLSNDGFTCKGGRMVSVNKGDWDKSAGVEADHSFHLEWLRACHRVLKPNGTVWVSGTYHSIFSCGFALQILGFHILNDIVWFKPNASPNLSGRFFTASHETLIWARKSKAAKHFFNYDAMKSAAPPEDTFKSADKQMRSVWRIGLTPQSEKSFGPHPTQKPLSLLRRIIVASTRPGDKVLDPFCGSGTTGVAAVEIGREFVGIDISDEYVDLARRRISSAKANYSDQGVLI